MNKEQVLALLRAAILATGTVVVTLGIMSPEDWGTLVNGLMTIAGAVTTMIPIVWAVSTHSTLNTIGAAAKLSEVQKIVTSPTLAVASPSPKVVDR